MEPGALQSPSPKQGQPYGHVRLLRPACSEISSVVVISHSLHTTYSSVGPFPFCIVFSFHLAGIFFAVVCAYCLLVLLQIFRKCLAFLSLSPSKYLQTTIGSLCSLLLFQVNYLLSLSLCIVYISPIILMALHWPWFTMPVLGSTKLDIVMMQSCKCLLKGMTHLPGPSGCTLAIAVGPFQPHGWQWCWTRWSLKMVSKHSVIANIDCLLVFSSSVETSAKLLCSQLHFVLLNAALWAQQLSQSSTDF